MAIAPIHDTGDECRLDGIGFFDRSMVYPPPIKAIKGGSTTDSLSPCYCLVVKQ